MHDSFLIIVIMLIAAAVFVVAIFKKLNLSPVLGYLVAGAFIGDNGLKVVTFEETKLLAEFGVVFLLFAIGLELSIERLKAMRRYVFGLGSMQVMITALAIAGGVVLISGNHKSAIIIAGGLALSSTAIVMQVITETKSQSMQVGRISLAILLLQDFVVVPLLVVVTLLGNDTNLESLPYLVGMSLVKAVVALLGIFIIGRLFLRPFFSFIMPDKNESNELPIAVTLLVVLTAAWGTEHFGLSLALGAFVSGVLVAETDFRGKAEKSIYPFKSLLLGLFFMSVGMNIDVMEIYNKITTIITFCIALIILKTIVIAGICILFGFNKGVSLHAGLLLSQGGEFAFILFGLGKDYGVLQESTANILLLVVTCSMAITPLLALIGQKFADKIERGLGRTPLQIIEYGTRDLASHVIIAGFGKVGKMVARVLEAEGINYVALDINDDVVREEISNGLPVFKGDASQISTLKAVGADRALTIIMSINNEITLKKSIKSIRNRFAHLDVIIRLKDLQNSKELYDIGVSTIIPQDYETGLQLGGAALKSVGISEYEINRIKEQFRAGNYVAVKKDDQPIEVQEDE
ncbi:MAG: cation:proton antiporter [Rickettsiaceae bacterium]|nr:cation:proton antiporter [Rickettsiaceae bacterium]